MDPADHRERGDRPCRALSGAGGAWHRCLGAFLAYFFLRDGGNFQRMLVRAVPNAFFERTLYLLHEQEAEAAMGLPAEAHSFAILPIGWPRGKFGPVRRAPLDKVVYADHWGTSWQPKA